MTHDEQRALVQKHYALNAAGDLAAQDLLTDDFCLAIPSYLPFGGNYRGKNAFRQAIPAVVDAIGQPGLRHLATTVGGNHAVPVEFTFSGAEDAPTQVAELFEFRGDKICEIRPFYSDSSAFLAAVQRRKLSRRSQD